MEILKFPHPALLKPCKPVTVFGPELRTILDAMFLTMRTKNGVGLAANQVGLDLRAFVMITELGSKLYVVNPEITSFSKNINLFKEGCLSAPGEFLVTGNRPDWVQVRFQDENGLNHGNVFHGVDAVCFAHENEHLDGKAFMQAKSISKSKRMAICKRWGLKRK